MFESMSSIFSQFYNVIRVVARGTLPETFNSNALKQKQISSLEMTRKSNALVFPTPIARLKHPGEVVVILERKRRICDAVTYRVNNTDVC